MVMNSTRLMLAVTAGLGMVVAATIWNHPAEAACTCPAEEIINCGHRGTGETAAGDPFPENTIPSFEQAVVEGADMIELDVVHSSDGVLVVFHDDTVDRTTDGSGCVGELTVAELKAFDAAVGTDLEGQGVAIPTLAEVLAAIDVDLNIELKLTDGHLCPDSDVPQMAADVVAAIHGDTKSRRIVVSSFDTNALTEIEQLDPAIYTGLVSLAAGDALVAAERGFDALNLLSGMANATVAEDVQSAGLDLNVWTENDAGRMRELVDLGVAMIVTDEPDIFATTREEICAEHTCNDQPPLADGADADGGCAMSPPSRRQPISLWLLATAGAWLCRCWSRFWGGGRRRHCCTART
jgi:glycerophosphoryl diester phosphodiesterase